MHLLQQDNTKLMPNRSKMNFSQFTEELTIVLIVRYNNKRLHILHFCDKNSSIFYEYVIH